MFNISKLGNAFLQGSKSLIYCDVRYCWNQILNVVSRSDHERSVHTQTPEDKQLKFKKCSNSEPLCEANTPKHIIEHTFFLSALNAARLLSTKAPDDYKGYEETDPLLLEGSDYSFVDQIDLLDPYDAGGCDMKVTQPEATRHHHILYSTRPSFVDTATNNPSGVEPPNLINRGDKSKQDEDKSYIINVFLNNQKASADDSVNVCLKDLAIKADDVCMHKLMKNIQKNYAVIDRICQNSENFEECKTRLGARLEQVWRNVFEHSKIGAKKEDDAVKGANDREEIQDKNVERVKRNESIEHGQNRVNIIVNCASELSEQLAHQDKVKNEMEQADIVKFSEASSPMEESNVQDLDANENLTPIENVVTQEALASIVPVPGDVTAEKVSNEYIKKRLALVEDRITALSEGPRAIAENIQHDYITIKNEARHLTGIDSKRNKENEINEETDNAQNASDIQIEEVVPSESGEIEDTKPGTRPISVSRQVDVIDQNEIQAGDDAVIKRASNATNNEGQERKDPNELEKDEEETEPRQIEERPVLVTDTESFSNVSQTSNEAVKDNSSVMRNETGFKLAPNEVSKELLEQFIIQENINRNANRKSIKRARENKFAPEIARFQQHGESNRRRAPENDQRKKNKVPSNIPKFQIKTPKRITSSVFKRTNNRLKRYNEKQLEQMDTLIKLAAISAPETTASKLMRFCKRFFKEDHQGDSQSDNTDHQENYIDKNMRGKKLQDPDNNNNAFKTQFRSWTADSASEEPPRPVEPDADIENSKLGKEYEPRKGSTNRIEDIFHQQKVFQQKCGVRERMLPHSGSNTFNGRQKMSYKTSANEGTMSVQRKILNMLFTQKRHYGTKDDCHKDDRCCEKAKSSDKHEKETCAKEKQQKRCAELGKSQKCPKPDPCDEIEKKYANASSPCCKKVCKSRGNEDGDDGPEKHRCETGEEMKKLKAGVVGCTSKCLVNRDPDGPLDPEPIEEPCPTKIPGDPRQDTVVQPELPKCDIMDQIGHFINKDASDEVANYFADNGYKNIEYFKTRQFTFYDINQYLTNMRNPVPNPFADNPTKTQMRRKRKKKVKKTTCTVK